MQVLEAFIWDLASKENLNKCSEYNQFLTYIGMLLIAFQPPSALLGRVVH